MAAKKAPKAKAKPKDQVKAVEASPETDRADSKLQARLSQLDSIIDSIVTHFENASEGARVKAISKLKSINNKLSSL